MGMANTIILSQIEPSSALTVLLNIMYCCLSVKGLFIILLQRGCVDKPFPVNGCMQLYKSKFCAVNGSTAVELIFSGCFVI